MTKEVRTSSSSTSTAGGASSSWQTAANADSVAAAGEHAHRPQRRLGRWCEQLVAPVEGGAHRAVAWRHAVTRRRQLADRAVEAVGELRQRQRPAARRGSSRPSGIAVETATDRANGGDLVGAQRPGRQVHRQAGEEQGAGVGVLDLLDRRGRREEPAAGRPGTPARRRRPATPGSSPPPAAADSTRAARRPVRRSPGRRCSQLSRTTTTEWSASAERTSVITSAFGSTCTPSAAASAAGTSSTSPIGARSTKNGPNLSRPGRAGGELDGEAGLADPADTGQRHQPFGQASPFPAWRARVGGR